MQPHDPLVGIAFIQLLSIELTQANRYLPLNRKSYRRKGAKKVLADRGVWSLLKRRCHESGFFQHNTLLYVKDGQVFWIQVSVTCIFIYNLCEKITAIILERGC